MRSLTCLAVAVLGIGSPGPVARAGPPPPQQLYVATWGSDSWPGTADRPFATPDRARRAVRERLPTMRSDIVVNLQAGRYELSQPLRLTEADSGRHHHRVIYQSGGDARADGKEQVVLSGGRRVRGWRVIGGVWQAPVRGLDTRQVYVDGRRAPRAALGGGLPGRVTTTATGYRTTSRVPLSWRNPDRIEFAYNFGLWVDARCGVAAIRPAGSGTTITMDQPCWRLANALYTNGEEPMAAPTGVSNSPSFLRTPGSWYLDRIRSVLSYRPRPGEDRRRTEAIVPALQTLVSGTGVHDVTFRGLTFAHATWLAPSQSAGFVSAWSNYKRPGVPSYLTVPGNVSFHHARRIRLERNTFTHLGAQGLELTRSSSDNVVEGNVFTDVSDGGILLGVALPATEGVNRGNRIANNWIHHIGVEYAGASGIWNILTRDTTIEHNQVNDVPYSGILTGPGAELPVSAVRNRIVANRVFRTNLVLADGGGIYLRGRQGTSYADGAVLQGNLVTDGLRSGFDIGLYTDDTAEWVTVRRNVVHSYVAAIGGCSEQPARPVRHIRYRGNFWDDAVPDWMPRRAYPGAWPSAQDECGDPELLEFGRNTLLDPRAPAGACAARPGCRSVVERAGLEPRYRHLLTR